MAMWNPWRGCHRKSEGCENCYIFRANNRKGIDTNIVYKTSDFYRPIEKDKKGNYKMKSGQLVYVCFSADFFVADADEWRVEAWKIIQQRNDLHFLFLTKRIERFDMGFPEDFTEVPENVTICCTVENQKRADERLSYFKTLPIKHKIITIQPMLEQIDISQYLDGIESVVVGGESGSGVRPFDRAWALDIRRQCIEAGVSFEYRQVGSEYIIDGVHKKVQRMYLCKTAREEGINYRAGEALKEIEEQLRFE